MADDSGLEGELISIDAIATNSAVATTIREAGADDLLAAKADKPTLLAEARTAWQLFGLHSWVKRGSA